MKISLFPPKNAVIPSRTSRPKCPRSAWAAFAGAALLLAQGDARATIVGPYASDASTIHLWHLNETTVPAIDSAGGTNLAGIFNGATLGNAAYTGFGNALNTLDGGQGATAAGGRDAYINPATTAGGSTVFTYADATSGAFTMEAVVWIGFNPNTNFGTTANGGNNRATSCQIMSIESGSSPRIFQFRLSPIGIQPTVGGFTNPVLEFINVTPAGGGAAQAIGARVPMTGPDAILSNNWYHVAASYNGLPSTAGNIKLYWTLMDTNRTAANQLTINSAVTMTSGALTPTATTAAGVFLVGNESRNKNGNFVGLIDEVRISKVERSAVQMMFTSTALSVVTQPASQFVAYGDNVTLSAVVGGEAPIYQWQHSSTNLPGATNSVLVLSNIVASQAGTYQLFATNSSSSTNTSVATITIGNSFSELFNTGLSDSRALLSSGDVDPHWQMIHSDDPSYPGPAAVVVGSTPGSYLGNGPNSMWLAPVATGNAAPGNYTNRTTFLLDTVDPTTAVLSGKWAVDNQGLDLLLNGVSTGLSNLVAGAQGGFQSFTITNGFVPGLNTIDIAILNSVSGGNNPTGWRFELRGVALALSNTAPFLTETDLPMNVTAQAQQTAFFSVAAAGSGPLSYQWFHGVTLLSGQTNRALTLPAVTTADNGTYSVTITNGAGSTNASATLTVVTPPALVWLGIDATSPTFWDMVTTNWLDTGSSANVPFAQFDDVRFDSSGSAQPVVDLILPLTPNSVRVDAATDYRLMSSASSGALGGSAVLIKTNVGTLILDTVNSNTGPTTISGGTLQVGNADANGALGSGPVNNNASLVFNRVDTFTVANSISGTGTVTMAGSGTVAVTGNNTYSGPTVISAGILNARNATALGTTGSGTTVASGGQLYIFGDVNLGAEPLTLSGATALRKAAGVGTIFGGPITLAADGGIEVDTAAATLNLTNAAGIVGTNVGLSLQGDGAGSRGTVSGPVSLGTGALTENGLGTWVLLATNNDWSGGTTLNGGVLQIGDGGANGSIGTNSITMNGGTTLTFNSALNLALNAPIQNSGTLLSFTGSGNITIGGTIQNNAPMTFSSSGNLVVSGEISGAGAVNQNGTGIVTLTGTNASYSGTTTLRATSVLRPGNSLALGTGTCTIGSAQTDTCRLELFGGLNLSNQITIFPRAFGTLTNPANILNVSGTNIVSPPASIVIPGGGNLLTLQSDSGRLILASGITAGGAGRDLVLKGAAAGEVQGNIDHSGGNSVLIWKQDAGTWTLWGANTPNAAMTISNGLLVINGTMDGSLITVAGGTLGGTGILSGPVVVNAGATLAPGSSIGTLTVNNNLTLQAGSLTSIELNKTAATSDQIIGLTNVTYGGTLVISNLSGTLAVNDSFKIFDALTYSGSFAALSPINPPGVGIRWNTNTLATDGTLRVQSTVSSHPVINSVANVGGNIVFGGTNGSPGGSYAVLSTNSLAIPRTNWPVLATGIFDGAGNFNYTNAILPSAPQAFFLLRAQ